MRRACLILLVSALALPVAAQAADRGGSDRAGTDGSLSVSAASGTLIVQGKGLIFGHFTQGTLMLIAYKPDDPNEYPAVSGARLHSARGVSFYVGSDVRFLLPAGRYTIELIATGIDLSAVGKGIVGASGFGSLDDGSLSVDGQKQVPLSIESLSQAFGGKSGSGL